MHRGGVVGELLGPVLGHQAALGQHVDVIGLVHGEHGRFHAVRHRTRLFGRAAVRLLDANGFAGSVLVFGDEGGVDVLEQFAGDVIGGIEQHDLGRVGGQWQAQGQRAGGQQRR